MGVLKKKLVSAGLRTECRRQKNVEVGKESAEKKGRNTKLVINGVGV